MKRLVGWVVVIVAIGGIAGALYHYYWQQNQAREEQAPPPPPMVSQAPPQTKPAPPPIRHPIGAAQTETGKPEAAQEQLPPLRESDAALRSALARLFGANALERFFHLKNIVHHVAATIDNLPRKQVSQRLMPVKSPPGRFLVTREGKTIYIDPNNYRRYTPYVRLIEAVSAKQLVTVYAYFYPLFQQAYEHLGYPHGYFNDRLIEVIDNLLATPDVRGPIKLIQPNVVYKFADPALERLSAGQKILIRMGNGNAAKIKAKLREIRRLLTSGSGELPAHK